MVKMLSKELMEAKRFRTKQSNEIAELNQKLKEEINDKRIA